MPKTKKRTKKLPKWLSDFILNYRKELRYKIDNAMAKRYYPYTMEYGPDEINRYILDFINPIHKPPTKYDIWSSKRKKIWCKICGEKKVPNSVICRRCSKPFSWICTGCDKIYISNSCRPRKFPVTASDSEYSGSNTDDDNP